MEIRPSATNALREALAIIVLLIILAPAQATTSNEAGATTSTTTGRPEGSADPVTVRVYGGCASPCEPNAPSPVSGAVDVPVGTDLFWTVPAPKGCTSFRLLGSTGGMGESLNPYSLVELATDPVREIAVAPANSLGFISSLDSSPAGVLYGADGDLCLINSSTGSARTICETLQTPDGKEVSLTGMAFHPNGTLYGMDLDLEAEQNVFYVIDMGKCLATEVCRISTAKALIWGIDFAPNGTLYGAFSELLKLDLAKGTATVVGRRFSLPFVNDIDYAPDGFIYAVDNMESRLYKIKPSTGTIVDEYGPYNSVLWGVASECVSWSCAGQTTVASIPSLRGASTIAERTWPERVGLWHVAGDELTAGMKRGLMLERLGWRTQGVAGEEETRVTVAGEAPSSPEATAARAPTDVTCDVYLDTVSPPDDLVRRDVMPPAAGDVWTCELTTARRLRPNTTYYWMVVAKRPCGVATAGAIWSFTTKGAAPRDTHP